MLMFFMLRRIHKKKLESYQRNAGLALTGNNKGKLKRKIV